MRQGSILALSKAITLVESRQDKHHEMALEIVNSCLPYTGNSIRIGITGVPGAGKSTFIEALGMKYHSEGRKIAVLAVDPSSNINKGSILGDKTRMNELSSLPDVFIRPSPSGEHLGGVHRATRESILLCEAAGFDTILIETVGVGQSEVAVHNMTDLFLLVAIPGAGDELQGIKRGIMEMVDIVAVNKSDGSNLSRAKETAGQLKSALHYYPEKENGWLPQVLNCSAIEKTGIDEICQKIDQFITHQKTKNLFEQHRLNQRILWFEESLKSRIVHEFVSQHQEQINRLKKEISALKINPDQAVDNLLKN